jgi:Immunoglobulin I-set domain.
VLYLYDLNVIAKALDTEVVFFTMVVCIVTFVQFNFSSGAPKITSDLSIRDMTVIAGEEFTITVPFIGNPKPKPTWTINGEEVIPGDRIKFETTTTSTVFINKCAKRSDLGNYTIQLVNAEGSDTASCKVLVVGKKYNHIY